MVTLCKHSKCALWAQEEPGGLTLCARAAHWFHEDFEPSQEASQYGFSFGHDVFLCVSTSDCVVSSIVFTVFLLDQYLKQ